MYTKQIDNSTIILGNISVPLSIIDGTTRLNISKGLEDLYNNITNKYNLTFM